MDELDLLCQQLIEQEELEENTFSKEAIDEYESSNQMANTPIKQAKSNQNTQKNPTIQTKQNSPYQPTPQKNIPQHVQHTPSRTPPIRKEINFVQPSTFDQSVYHEDKQIERIKNYFGSTYFQRGFHYYKGKHVFDIDLDQSNSLSAKCYGSRLVPYALEIQIDCNNIEFDIKSSLCNCPCSGWSEPCKHGVAVLLEYYNRIKENQPLSNKMDLSNQLYNLTQRVDVLESLLKQYVSQPALKTNTPTPSSPQKHQVEVQYTSSPSLASHPSFSSPEYNHDSSNTTSSEDMDSKIKQLLEPSHSSLSGTPSRSRPAWHCLLDAANDEEIVKEPPSRKLRLK